MGMYTNLKFCARIKPEYESVVQRLVDGERWEDIENPYISDDSPFSVWARVGRCNSIPHGFCCVRDYENRNVFSNGWWEVSCSLKNYEGEIEHFLSNILPVLADYAEGETHYEEMPEPDTFTLRDDVLETVYGRNEGLY